MPIYKLGDKLALFVHVPKTGGTSVNGYLRKYGSPCFHYVYKLPGMPIPPQHWHADILTKVIGDFPIDSSFMFVRNPVARLQSEYRMRMEKYSEKDIISFDAWWMQCRNELKKCPHYLQNHLRPQVEFLYPGINVFRFEDGIYRQICHILKALGLESPAAEIHARPGQKISVEVSKLTLESIREYYRKDFCQFGYSISELI